MSHPASKLPWEPGFIPALPDTNLIGSVTGAITQAEQAVTGAVQEATQIGSEVAQTAEAATTAATDAAAAVAGAAQAAGEVVGVVVSPPPAPTSSAAPTSPPFGGTVSTGNILADVEKAALDAAKATTATILPTLQKTIETRIAAKAQAEIQGVLEKIQGGETTPAVPTLSDFAHADARSRAIRTFLVGIALSVLWGLVNVLGNVATVDWTNRNALPQVLTLATGSVVSSLIAYVGRLVDEPKHITNATIIPGSSPS